VGECSGGQLVLYVSSAPYEDSRWGGEENSRNWGEGERSDDNASAQISRGERKTWLRHVNRKKDFAQGEKN